MTWMRYRKYKLDKDSPWDEFAPLMAKMAMAGKWGSDWGDWSGDWSSGGARGSGGGGRRRRGRMFGSGELRLALLALIAKEPRHGYELIKAIEDMTGGQYAPSPGAVYPTLQLLADEGKIEEAEADGAKKPFAVTEEGKAELEERSDEVDGLMDRLGEHGERAEKVRSPDL
ncbi:MAG: PadR family transcriptional regulator, partial [Pseudomonadota bacterium]